MDQHLEAPAADERVAMYRNQFHPVPIPFGQKYPAIDDWPSLRGATEDDIAAWRSRYRGWAGTGILLGGGTDDGVCAVDSDITDDAASRAVWDLIIRMFDDKGVLTPWLAQPTPTEFRA